jgi:hypothetical protein
MRCTLSRSPLRAAREMGFQVTLRRVSQYRHIGQILPDARRPGRRRTRTWPVCIALSQSRAPGSHTSHSSLGSLPRSISSMSSYNLQLFSQYLRFILSLDQELPNFQPSCCSWARCVMPRLGAPNTARAVANLHNSVKTSPVCCTLFHLYPPPPYLSRCRAELRIATYFADPRSPLLSVPYSAPERGRSRVRLHSRARKVSVITTTCMH